MSAFARSLAAEIDHLARDRRDQLLLFVMPFVLLGLMAAMLVRGTPSDLPVAVVGGPGDAIARRLVDTLDSSPALRVAAVVPDEAAAMTMVRRGDIIAFVELPPSLAPRDRPTVRISYNAAYLSSGGVAESAMASAIAEAAQGAAIERGPLAGAGALRLPEVPVSVTILANPGASFEWYLQALVDPAVLHLLVACAAAMAVGRTLADGSTARWAAASGNPAAALAGKLLPYVAIGGAWAAAWLVWIAGIRGWHPGGSLLLIWIGQILLLTGTAVISAMLVILARETSTALAVSAVYAGSALAYSGGSLPVRGGSLFARGWSGLLPFTHYLDLQMDQWLGAPATLALRQLALLSLYLTIPGSIAVLALRRSAAR